MIKRYDWSDIELFWLKILYPKRTKEELERIFAPRTFSAITSKAQRIGLKRDWRLKQEVFKQRAKERWK